MAVLFMTVCSYQTTAPDICSLGYYWKQKFINTYISLTLLIPVTEENLTNEHEICKAFKLKCHCISDRVKPLRRKKSELLLMQKLVILPQRAPLSFLHHICRTWSDIIYMHYCSEKFVKCWLNAVPVLSYRYMLMILKCGKLYLKICCLQMISYW